MVCFFSLKVISQSRGYLTICFPPSNNWQARQEIKNETSMNGSCARGKGKSQAGQPPPHVGRLSWDFLAFQTRARVGECPGNVPGIVRYLIQNDREKEREKGKLTSYCSLAIDLCIMRHHGKESTSKGRIGTD